MNLSIKADRLLKKASDYERRSKFKKLALFGIDDAIIMGYMLAAPFVANLIGNFFETDSVPEDIESLLENCDDYERSYGFKDYKENFDKLREICKKLSTLYTQIKQIVTKAKDNNDPKISHEENLKKIKEYIDASNEFQKLWIPITTWIEDDKGIGGKFLGVIQMMHLDLGLARTDSTIIKEKLKSLHDHLTEMTPELEKAYKELQEKVIKIKEEQLAKVKDEKSKASPTPSSGGKTPSSSSSKEEEKDHSGLEGFSDIKV